MIVIGFNSVSGKRCLSMGYLEPYYLALEAATLIKEKLDENI